MMQMDFDRGVITVQPRWLWQPWWLWSYYDTKGYRIVPGEWLWVCSWTYTYNGMF